MFKRAITWLAWYFIPLEILSRALANKRGVLNVTVFMEKDMEEMFKNHVWTGPSPFHPPRNPDDKETNVTIH